MARYLGSVCKQCRTSGEKLYLKGDRCYTSKCAITKQRGKPGQARFSRSKTSEYASQLREKQKVKYMYGILESQFYNYFKAAAAKSGVTGENLLQTLERRLDNVIYRLGIAKSRRQARQFVKHGHVKINGKRVDIPSYMVSRDEKISFDENIKLGKQNIENSNSPGWLEVDKGTLAAKVLELPNRSYVDYEVNEQLIVEFYSR